MNDPFAQSKPFGANLGYYFNEDFGIEASYMKNEAKKNESVSKFNTIAANISPNYNLPGQTMSLALTFTPFYAKLAFMNMAIMYFDMGFTAGFGMSEYDQVVRLYNGTTPIGEGKIRQASPHFEVGVMQQLFITKNFAFRLDIKNAFYNEITVTYDPGIIGLRQEENAIKNNTHIMFGLTLFTN
jgi:outer membrane beta-barrel protein